MKHLRLLKFLPLAIAGLVLAAPATSLADRKVTVYRDRDGDGHYNKKTYEKKDRHHDVRYYSRGDYRHSGRPYGYYSRPYYYSRPSVAVTYSRPVYSTSSSYYSDDLAVDVQRELRRRGYYRGPVDGDIGPGTRSAIRAYQDDRGLAVTGRIDRSLLRSLGVG